MIKINLLPVRASKKREAGKQWLILFGLVIGATLLGNWFWLSQTHGAVEQVKGMVNKYNSDLTTLNKIIGEVKNIKNDKQEIQKKLDVLKKLKDNRTGPVKVMDEMQNIIPSKIWILAWDENAGNLTLNASGANLDDIASFMVNLKGSKFFENVVLRSTKHVSDIRVDFTITCKVKYSA